MEVLEQRRGFYKLLSRIFLQEMSEDSLKKIENLSNFTELFPAFSSWEERNKKSRYKLINETLNVDFTDITIMHLTPYESFYVREDGKIESGGANPIVQTYNEYDYRVNLDVARTVSGDHIGIELEFMAMLIDAEIKASKNSDKEAIKELEKEQFNFLKSHILEFAPMYLLTVIEQARTPFYKDAGKLALEFLLEDFEYLKGEN